MQYPITTSKPQAVIVTRAFAQLEDAVHKHLLFIDLQLKSAAHGFLWNLGNLLVENLRKSPNLT